MQRMRIKSGYVIGLVFVGVLVAATPWIDGYFFKDNYIKLLEARSADVSKQFKIVDYQLGWLSSTAKFTIDFNSLNAKTPDPTKIVTIEQQITHGPFLQDPINGGWVLSQAAIQTYIHVDKKWESMLVGDAATDGIIQAETLVSFANHYASQVRAPLLNYKNDSQAKVSWQGLTGLVNADFTNDKLKHLKSDFSMGVLTFQHPSLTVTVPSMALQGEKNCQEAVICTGTSTMSMPMLTMVSDNKSYKLSGLMNTAAYGVEAGDAYNANFEIAINKLDIPNYIIGPINLKFSVSNLNATELKKMIDSTRKLADTGEDIQSQQMAVLSEYNLALPRIFMATTVIREDAVINTTYGNFTSAAKFYWPANTPLPVSSKDLAKMNFTLDMRAATALVSQLVSMVDGVSNVPAPVVVATPDPEKNLLASINAIHVILDPFVQEKRISAEAVNAIVDLNKQHLSPAIYTVAVKKVIGAQHLPLMIAGSVNQKLQEKYMSTYVEADSAAVSSDDHVVTPVAVATPPGTLAVPVPKSAPVAEVGKMQAQLNAIIKQGFVVQDKNDYVVSVVYENGTMKINNVVVPLPDAVAAATK
jgi:uncharacterized protein YdgA (DUF945 family)